MRDLNATFTTEKNKQENKPIFLYTIYDYDGDSTNLYFAEYDTNVTFDSQEYTKFPITHENIGENTKGEIDAVKIMLANISRLIQAYLEDYDFRGKKVRILTVWADHLDDADAYIEDIFYIDSYSADQDNVVFTLTSKFDVLGVEIPARKYSRNYCGWKFKSTQCGYAGDETECSKTLQRCRILANSARFGGFPSVPVKPVYVP